jgi:hypothetical protein
MQNRPFSPRFLKKLDEKWMKKYPLLWSSRIHLVLYYGGLLLIPILIFSFFAYFSPLSENAPWTGNVLLGIIALIGLVIWMIYLLRFNPYKRFYIEKSFSFFRTFLLYLFITLFFSSWIFIPQYVGYIGTKMRFNSKQIEKDMQELNNSLAGEAYYKTPDYFVLEKETLLVSKLDSFEYSYSDPTEVTNTITYDDRITDIERKYDSYSKINDTVVEVVNYPSFNFISIDYSSRFGTKQERIKKYHDLLQDQDSYENYHASIGRITGKYLSLGTAEYRHYYDYDEYDPSPGKYKKIEDEFRGKYQLGIVKRNVQVMNRKLRFLSEFQAYLRVVYYLAIGLAMLLFTFRHSNARAFFLTLLSYFVLFLITLVFTFAVSFNTSQLFDLLIGYSLVCLFIGITIVFDKRKLMVKMIALNLFFLGTIFIPLLVAHQIDKDWFRDHYLNVEIFTFIAILVMMIFVYRPLYRKWYTLPDE